MSRIKEIVQNWNDIETIRNISIISHVDHGKTTLSDYLMASGGLLPTHLAGSLRALDDLPEEQRRGITIETSYVSYMMQFEDKNYLVNLIDTPGHVDFSGKVSESLRLVDGSFILVDAVEGIMAQTKTVLDQAIEVGLELTLFINKIDRLISELNYTPQQIQNRIEQIIGEVAQIYRKMGIKKGIPKFTKGTIIIGSALHGWGIDSEYVKQGGKLDEIITDYNVEELKNDSNISLLTVINRCIANNFPNPKKAQEQKVVTVFEEEPPKKLIDEILECRSDGELICLVGRVNRIPNTFQITYIVRLFSGSLSRGTIAWSSIDKGKIKITKVFQMFGRTNKDVKVLGAGQIGGISTSKPILPGDMLIADENYDVKLKNISYVQEPVISISIEPKDIREIGKVQQAIQNIVESTPGLKFENNVETGELVIMGVGSLQLDVLRTELIDMNLNVDISDPVVLQYEMPCEQISYISEKQEGVEVMVNMGSIEDNEIVYNDVFGNYLALPISISKETMDGLVEVFRQYMRISPQTGEKIRNFKLIIKNYPEHRNYRTYESGMVIGSQIIKEAMFKSQTKIFEPYYEVEITLPENYIGAVIQEIQKYHAKINNITYGKRESLIICQIRVIDSPKLADNLRQITDGYGFWAYKSIEFLSKTDFYD